MDKKHIKNSYILTKCDLELGTPVKEFDRIIKERESKEDYEGCAGIKKAVEEFKRK